MEEIRDQMELANEISDVISQPVGFGVEMDEVRRIRPRDLDLATYWTRMLRLLPFFFCSMTVCSFDAHPLFRTICLQSWMSWSRRSWTRSSWRPTDLCRCPPYRTILVSIGKQSKSGVVKDWDHAPIFHLAVLLTS